MAEIGEPITMYEELVRKLRNRRICIQSGGDLEKDFPLLQDAADAIEHLVDLIHRYKEICDKMADNIDKLRDLCRALYYQNKTNTIIPADKEGEG